MKTLYEAPDVHEPLQSWCVYSHFDAQGQVEKYVQDALKSIQACGFKIVFLSTSPCIDEQSLRTLQEHVSTVILRDNVGYDFGSYKLGIQYLKETNSVPTSLLITNDSVFGPLHPLAKVLEDAQGYDLYGITDSIEFNYHLQSYFILYGPHVLQSPAFHAFWDSVELFDSGDKAFKQKIISQYEVGGSQFFMQQGFRLGAAFGFKKLVQDEWQKFIGELDLYQTEAGRPIQRFNLGYNASHTYWKNLVIGGCPYIKRELLALNPINANISDWASVIQTHTSYHVDHIVVALHKQTGTDDFFFTSLHASTIAEHLREDGSATLPINPHLKPWQGLFDTPDQRDFVFDETHYLFNNPDVRKAVDNQILASGLKHFIQQGHKENRILALRRR